MNPTMLSLPALIRMLWSRGVPEALPCFTANNLAEIGMPGMLALRLRRRTLYSIGYSVGWIGRRGPACRVRSRDSSFGWLRGRLADSDSRRCSFRPSGAAADTQPLGTCSARHNLPTAISNFIGREREQADIREHLANARLLTLAALDGVWLVRLGSLADEVLVAHRVGEVLGVRETMRYSMLAALSRALTDWQLLLVLDQLRASTGARNGSRADGGTGHTTNRSCSLATRAFLP
jgi:hypothetical protein